MSVGGVPEVHPGVTEAAAGAFGGPGELNGPRVGMLAYSGPGGNLNIRINVEFAQPNVSYDVFLIGGPAEATSTEFIMIGSLATNAVGRGAGAYMVSHAMLMAAKFRSGYRTDHVELLYGSGSQSGSSMIAGTINYHVCREKQTAIHNETLATLFLK